jgi:hypothetical protein
MRVSAHQYMLDQNEVPQVNGRTIRVCCKREASLYMVTADPRPISRSSHSRGLFHLAGAISALRKGSRFHFVPVRIGFFAVFKNTEFP